MRRTTLLLALVALAGAFTARSAEAVQIQVDWTSTNGTGVLSGTFGVFDVTSAGQEFSLPSDGSLTAVATGFTNPGFANTTYVLDMPGGDLRFRFDSLAPIQGQLVDTASDRLWGSVPCGFGGLCVVEIDAAAGGRAEAGFDTGPFYAELLSYTYTVLPEPAAGLSLALALLGIALTRRPA